MKRTILLFMGALAFSTAAFAASSTADLSSGPLQKEKYDLTPAKTGSETRRVKSDANLYYVRKDRRGDNIYRDFKGCSVDGCDPADRSVRAETKKTAAGKKYNMNNPFFQPQEMQFVSETDLSYAYNSMNLNLTSIPNDIGDSSRYVEHGFLAMEKASFGITDEIAITGMFRFAHVSKAFLGWVTSGPPFRENDRETLSELDTWGLRAEWRFLNDEDWIMNIAGEYQWWSIANMFALEAKAGYKNDDTTLYGFARASYSTITDGDGYGIRLTNQDGDSVYFTQSEDEPIFSYEVGVGVFAAMNKDWSADLRVAWMDDDWHNQVYTRATVAYQPWKNTSLALWGRIAIWDNANGFDKSNAYAFIYDIAHPSGWWKPEGTARFSKYNSLSAGLTIKVAF